ncbi:hypothetical protein FIV42_07480 [Persicimonas caeni]|uniref:Matrixin family metalloprotease n=1 Tax=Persicimonas caeni TaxID=2292766 RepID=A0A4Y6PQR4_PERCE|nr:NF038122 family metalloprotease [Persicimonas caeni]QDG50580.1 hypothetical protein FIV42_07480 [Persicimonas caeni]QED31801.1 hypothetical protein FRD00_07475 [Persicimonas caeni]
MVTSIAVLATLWAAGCGFAEDGAPGEGESTRTARVGAAAAGSSTGCRGDALYQISVDGERGRTVEVGDLLSDEVFAQSGPQNFEPFVRDLPVCIVIRDSSDITINIEDIVGDNIFVWALGQTDVSNLKGGRAPWSAGRRASSDTRFALRLPVEIVVENSSDINVNIEDVFGDNIVAWTRGDALVSNLRGGMLPHSKSDALQDSRLDLEVPVDIDVRRSEGVVVDIEDVVGDVIFSWSEGDADLSNLRGAAGPTRAGHRPRGAQASIAVPVDIDVRRSEQVVLDIEDIFGDVDVVSSDESLNVSNLRGRRRAAGDRSVAVHLPVDIRIDDSRGVTVDIEDIFGDNDILLLDGPTEERQVRVEVPVGISVHRSNDVQVAIAEILSNNRFVLSEGTDEVELDSPGRYERPGGELVLRPQVERDVTRSSAVDISIEKLFVGNTAGGPVQVTTSAAPAPTYLGAQPAQSGGFDIVIAPGARLVADPQALAAVERAAQQWEDMIDEPITVTIDVKMSDWLPHWAIAQAHSPQSEVSYDLVRTALFNDANDEVQETSGFDDAVTTRLPSRLQATLPSGVQMTDKVTLTAANAKALGFEDPNAGEADAAIVLNANVAFDVDNSDGVTAGTTDLETAAAHEIGHALGFVSAVDAINRGETAVSPSTLDLYRFEAGGANDPSTIDEFGDFPRFFVPGRDANFDAIDQHYAMSTGADGHQARHWKAPRRGQAAIGIMGPHLDADRVITVSCADMRALDLIGYEVDGCR